MTKEPIQPGDRFLSLNKGEIVVLREAKGSGYVREWVVAPVGAGGTFTIADHVLLKCLKVKNGKNT